MTPAHDSQAPRRAPRRSLVSLLLASVLLADCVARPSGPGVPAPARESYDVVITGGKVVDGAGNPWFYGDVGLRGDRIVRVTPAGVLAGAHAARRIDARGMVVAPGFIDIQGQSYGPFLTGDGRVVSKVTQGITTEILGEGTTPAPANARLAAHWADGDTTIERILADEFGGEHGFDAWLRAMEAHGISPNVGSFLGATTPRVYAMGAARGAPTPAQLDTMRAVVRRAMADGAFGLASALIYPPASFASTGELVEMAKAMAPYGGVYITHMRSEGDRLLEAMDEALRIGRDGGVPVEIYHLKAAGVRNWPKAALAIAKIDSARAAGQDVEADMYAYVAGGTALASCAPPWASADGRLLDNLRDSATRARVKAEMLADGGDYESLCSLATPAGVQVVGFRTPELKRYEGKRLADIARDMGKDWVDALIDLTLAERAQLGGLFFLMDEGNVALQMRQPWMKFGTDAEGWDPDSAKGRLTHPRAYGNYPRILGKYVRDERVMPLEEAIRKMTSAVATRLSIPDRGLIRPGMYADIVVFDPATVSDAATYEQPHRISSGIRHVLVNGVEVVRDGAHTGAKPGRVVRGPGWTGER
ncbi:MAG TPA: D-aminoacylase [Gemmatimonadaceae bacterium]|nr:D-aminoacylase [Gemmatimonadaceae bacterium]